MVVNKGNKMIDIVLFVIGITGLIGGNLTISKKNPIKGYRARIVGAILTFSSPLSFGIVYLIFTQKIPPHMTVPLVRWLGLLPAALCILTAFIYLYSTDPDRKPETLKFWLTSIIPVVSLYIANNLTVLYHSLFNYSMNSPLLPPSFNFRLEFPSIIIGFFIPVVIAFMTTLIFPFAANKQNAILFALPVSILHFYYFSISDWILPGITSIKYPGDTPGAGYQEIINGIEYILVSLLLLATVALISWVASSIRRK
jgi:hypothetical protein